MKRAAWRDDIAPVTERYLALYSELVDAIKLMRPEDQLALLVSAHQATQTNCGWEEYAAAQMVKTALPSASHLIDRAQRIPLYVHKERSTGRACGSTDYRYHRFWSKVTCPACLALR